MRRRLLRLAGPVALVALATGCAGAGAGAGDVTRSPAPSPAHTTGSAPAAASTAPTAYHRYVALGDSYTAAPLVPPSDLSTICLRSEVNYPALLTEAMPGTRLTDVSCSGATTDNVTRPQTGRGGTVPPQIDAVTARTDLVTIGLGGNDHGLFGRVLGECLRLAPSEPEGDPCRTTFEGGQPDRLATTFAEIRSSIADVVELIRERAPDARVLVVGYPQIVPASGRCDDLPLAAGDYSFGRLVNSGLTTAVRRGAADARAEYVDLWGPTAGHDICAADPWINGRVTSADRALAYHPLAVEQRHVAEIIEDQLRQE